MNIASLNKITRIYLVTNCYGDPNKVYIGKTISTRLTDHKKTFGNEITYDFIDEIPSILFKDWIPLESFWIEYFRYLGFDIQNKNKGGGGVEFCSDKHKLEISLGNKGKIKSLEHKNIVSKKLQKIIIQYDLKGNFIKEWDSIKLASKETKITGISANLRKKQKTAGNFIWSYKNDPLVNFIKLAHKSCKKVIQYNLNGTQIKIWESIKKAGDELKISKTGINSCCKYKKYTAGNYIWRYEYDKLESDYKIPIHKSCKSIIQYDLNKNFIKHWTSAKDASQNLKIHSSSITQCCRKIVKTAGNYIWEYKN